MFVPENVHTSQTHKGKHTVSQFNHIPVRLCGLVCFVCSLCIKSTQKETMPTAATRQPSGVYKTNKPWSYLNRRARGECECSSDQTTATIVCQAVCSSLIIRSSKGPSLTSYSNPHSFKLLPGSTWLKISLKSCRSMLASLSIQLLTTN